MLPINVRRRGLAFFSALTAIVFLYIATRWGAVDTFRCIVEGVSFSAATAAAFVYCDQVG